MQVFTVSRTNKRDENSHYSGDIFTDASMRQILQVVRPEIVIHAAWDTTLGNYMESPSNLDYQIASLKFARNCIEFGVRKLIIFGSSAEYGEHFNPVCAEMSTAKPVSAYGHAKYNLLCKLQKEKVHESLDLIWLRIFQPYGPMQDADRFIPTLIRKLRANDEITLNFPNQIRDWINLFDISSAVTFVISENLTGVLDVGTGIGTKNLDLVLTLKSFLGHKGELRMNINHENLDVCDSLVVHKESRLFKSGWKPDHNLISGFVELLENV